jgi:hypothetical protein
MVEYREEKARPIPEMLGFAPDEFGHTKAYSQESYQARYLLYPDEAARLLARMAPDSASARDAHPHIDRELGLRYIRDQEYRARIDAGYAAMESKMRGAGAIPEDEQRIVDALNARFPDPTDTATGATRRQEKGDE